MNKYFTPLALSEAGDKHLPAVRGSALDPALLPLSAAEGNLLKLEEDGFAVTADGLVSLQEPNALVKNFDGKLRVDATKLVDGNVFTVTENMVGMTLKLTMNGDSNTLFLLGKDDAVVAQVVLPVVPGLPTVTEILDDFQPPKPNGYEENPYPEGTYFHWVFPLSNGETQDLYVNVTKLVDIYTSGRAIHIVDNVVSVNIPELKSDKTDNAIIIDESGRLYVKAALTADVLGPGIILNNGKLTVDLNALIEPESPLYVTEAGKLDIDMEKLRLGVSEDDDNILSLGSDGKVYLAGDPGAL